MNIIRRSSMRGVVLAEVLCDRCLHMVETTACPDPILRFLEPFCDPCRQKVVRKWIAMDCSGFKAKNFGPSPRGRMNPSIRDT
jgi:hypothetical protein